MAQWSSSMPFQDIPRQETYSNAGEISNARPPTPRQPPMLASAQAQTQAPTQEQMQVPAPARHQAPYHVQARFFFQQQHQSYLAFRQPLTETPGPFPSQVPYQRQARAYPQIPTQGQRQYPGLDASYTFRNGHGIIPSLAQYAPGFPSLHPNHNPQHRNLAMPVGSMGPPDVPPSPSSRGIITPAVPPPAPVPQRPFSCPICGLKFQRKHDRKRHMHVHGEGKRFTCGLCHEEFARRDALLVSWPFSIYIARLRPSILYSV